jgi:hypothetical protein
MNKLLEPETRYFKNICRILDINPAYSSTSIPIYKIVKKQEVRAMVEFKNFKIGKN